MTEIDRSVLLSIPVPTLSQNVLQRMHWTKAKAHKDELHLLIRSAINGAGGRSRMPGGCNNGKWTRPVDPPEGFVCPRIKVSLRLIRFGPRTLDRGNLIGGAKPLIDVLTQEGLIVDDNPTWLSDAYEQEKSKRGQTVLELQWSEPLPEPETAPEDPDTTPKRTEGERAMFEFNQNSVTIERIEVRQSYKDEEGVNRFVIRTKLSVEDVDLETLPELETTLEAARNAGEQINGTVVVGFKSNEWPIQVLSFADSENRFFHAKILGSPVNRPKASIVGETGAVNLQWTVEDRRLPEKELNRFCRGISSETLIFSTSNVQGELPLESVG